MAEKQEASNTSKLPDKDPPPQENCDLCGQTASQAGVKSLMRCVRCRDRFYCSATCQKNDWTSGFQHKYGCSKIPSGPPIPRTVERTDVLKSEVARLQQLLRDCGPDNPIEQATQALQELRVADPLQPKKPFPAELGALKISFIHIMRLLFLDHLSRYPSLSHASIVRQCMQSDKIRIDDSQGQMRLWGWKVLQKPYDLSPWEYQSIILRFLLIIPSMQCSEEERRVDMELLEDLMACYKRFFTI